MFVRYATEYRVDGSAIRGARIELFVKAKQSYDRCRDECSSNVEGTDVCSLSKQIRWWLTNRGIRDSRVVEYVICRQQRDALLFWRV